jgi:hypothetical protein
MTFLAVGEAAGLGPLAVPVEFRGAPPLGQEL